MKVTVTASAASAATSASLVLYFLFACGLLIHSAAADQLRPSDHGLEHQLTPPAGENSSLAMMSFFGASSLESPRPPIGMNYSTDDGSWLRSGRSEGVKNRLREILLVASLVCGVSGVALLLTSAMLFLIKLRRGRRSESTVDNASSFPQPPEINDSMKC